MAIRPFLAMTAAEMRNCPHIPPKIAWMACHFSPYGRGLSNVPHNLPEGSLLVVDDITPIHGHDPEVITRQLMDCTDALGLSGILLDFQRPEYPETAELVKYLADALPYPFAVSEYYAKDIDIPIFLPPAPPSVPLQEHLAPWKNREIWLDVSSRGETLILTEEGCNIASLPPWEFPESGFTEEALHCHYHITLQETTAEFTLWRTKEDLAQLLMDAEKIGVTTTVGLYQELK